MTTAVDALATIFASLAEDEQEEGFERLSQIRLLRLAGAESDTARMIRSLLRVADQAGRAPTADDYREIAPRLIAAGESVETFTHVHRHFGTWRRALEAIDLTTVTTPRRIQARFDSRRLGKVWRYSDQTLRETIERCVAELGHVPQVSEFEWWRERERELARANGTGPIHLPSPTPYRKRWKSWTGAMLHFGYSLEQVQQRWEPS